MQEKTFRRFSPTFIPDEQGKVISSETNMGGLVNRAAFKSIQPLFAKGAPGSPISESATEPQTVSSGLPPQPSALKSMTIQAKLHALKLIDSVDASEESIVQAIEAKFSELETENRELKNRIEEAIQARASSQIEAAVNAGRIAPADTDAKSFWLESLIRDEAKAVKALEALPSHPVLATVTAGEDAQSGLLDKMSLQTKKLAEVHAANPQADFQTVFAKAQTEAPDLFR